ncbi:MAG TPA: YihY/virulence factor BrkB family protein, partial [Pedococcus sp.]
MAREGASRDRERTAPPPDSVGKPESPPDLVKPSWVYTAKKAFTEFGRDHCTDLAAALTYYAVLAIFPALLAIVSLLGVFGQGESTTAALLDLVRQIGQGDAADQLRGPISQMTRASSAGFALVLGILGALWSASGYVGAFGRAMNRVYQIDEGRPIWKLRPVMLLVTLITVVLAALVLVGLVISGPAAKAVGDAVGLGATAVLVWNIAKWPVMLAV